MKKIVLLLLLFVIGFPGFSQENEEESSAQDYGIVTTYYLIRHAEKDRSDPNNKDPHLTQAGVLRAAKWSYVLENIKLDAVYSTQYNRTMETAMPTAEKNGISELTFYDPRDMDMKGFIAATHGKTLLIVGHSNTTPDFANKIIGKQKYAQIDDSNNSNLYIINISSNGEVNDMLLVID